jgi:PKD repeat protein
VLLIAGAGLVSLVAPALATESVNAHAYGELARIGGFDSALYDGGAYDGTTYNSGKFVDPTGFAVDPQDGTPGTDGAALYVVDRISSQNGTTTRWRLQKLDDQDNVLGVTTFSLPNEVQGGGIPNRAAIAGLVVDNTAGRVYALAVGAKKDGAFYEPVAEEILAWSTTPASGQLVAATGSGLVLDTGSGDLGTTGALVSSKAQLSSGATPLYFPQGIALDVTGGQRDLAIEATDDAASSNQGNGIPPGNTFVQQIATAPQGGSATGALLNQWSVTSLTGEANRGPAGLSTNPDGSLSVILTRKLESSTADVVNLAADLSTATPLLDKENATPDLDRQPLFDGQLQPFPTGGGTDISSPAAAGPPLVQLTNGLYASIFTGGSGETDGQAPSHMPFYWHSAEAQFGFVANVGVRLLGTTSQGAISDGVGGTTLNTLGNSTTGPGTCNLDTAGVTLAAGADGTIWALLRGADSSAQQSGATLGRQLVEFGPGASTACPQPSGTFKMNGKSAETPLTVSAGTEVKFDASSITHSSPVVYAYDWDLDGNATNGPASDGFETINAMQDSEGDIWPSASASYTYTTPGQYHVRVKLVSDYGTYEKLGTINVTSAEPPTASFMVSSVDPLAGEPVGFDASASAAAFGSTLVNYHWEWGDGTAEDDASTPVTHTYASPGAYPVKLTVTDSASRQSHVFTATVNVGSSLVPPPGGGGNGGGGSNGGSSNGGGSAAVDHSPTSVSPHASATGAVAKITLSCPATKVSCGGSVEIKTASAVAASGKAKKGKKPKKSQLVLGRGSFSISGGQSQTVTIHLSSQGATLLTKLKRLGVLVIVSAHDSFGDAGTNTVSLTLKAPAKKAKHK